MTTDTEARPAPAMREPGDDSPDDVDPLRGLPRHKLPAEPEAECALVSDVLCGFAEALPDALRIVTPADFHTDNLARAWAAIADLHARGEPVDGVTVGIELRRRGEYDRTLADLIASMDAPSSGAIVAYAERVARAARLRRLAEHAAMIARMALRHDADPAAVAERFLRARDEDATRAGAASAKRSKQLAVPLSRFLEKCAERIEYLAPPFLLRGTFVLVVGPPKAAKTWFVAYLAVSVAADGARVVFVEEEGRAADLRDRILPHVAPGEPRDSLAIVFREGIRLDDPACVARLVAECSGAALVILDPFALLHRGDENEAAEMGPVLGAVQTIIRETGATVVLVHHTRKGDTWDGGRGSGASGDVRGSGAIVAAADSVILVQGVPDAQRVPGEVRFRVRNPSTRNAEPFAPRTAAIKVVRGGGLAWIADDSASEPEGIEALLGRVLAALPTDPAAPTTRDLMVTAIGGRRESVLKAIKAGIERGDIREATGKRRGLYRALQTELPVPGTDGNRRTSGAASVPGSDRFPPGSESMGTDEGAVVPAPVPASPPWGAEPGTGTPDSPDAHFPLPADPPAALPAEVNP